LLPYANVVLLNGCMAKLPDYDKILFERIRDDDRLALNALFTQYYQKLCSFANTYVHNTEEAEESVADVFVSLWKARKHLLMEKSLKAYLYASVKHAALATLRKRNPLLEDIDSLPDSMFVQQWGTEQVILLGELEQRLSKAIETLPLRCRQVFLMSRMEALSYKEISEILGISEKTVENHLVKAISILREILKPPRQKSLHTSTLTEA
jgi:RNA polymerase sigma-70 factor (ECF subfamily)